MTLIANGLVVLVAILHLYFLALEMFLWTRPLGSGHRVIRHHVECSPCFLRECPLDFRCMKEIDPQRAVEAVVKILT